LLHAVTCAASTSKRRNIELPSAFPPPSPVSMPTQLMQLPASTKANPCALAYHKPSLRVDARLLRGWVPRPANIDTQIHQAMPELIAGSKVEGDTAVKAL
jgi:hypothetical protein